MTKLEIKGILETAYKKDFLDSIEYLFSKNKEYNKSEFFKNTRISLVVLYEKYYATQTREHLSKDLIDIILNFDVEYLIIKLEEFLESFNDSEKITEILDRIMNFFDKEELSEYRNDIEKVFNKVLNKK